MVPAKAFYVTQIQKAELEAPVRMAAIPHIQPVGDLSVLVAQLCLITIASLRNYECCTGRPELSRSLQTAIFAILRHRDGLTIFFHGFLDYIVLKLNIRTHFLQPVVFCL